MSQIDISVPFATYNRAHLLERSLMGYERQSFPKDRFELVVVDDWSDDDTDKLLRDWAARLNIVTIRPKYKPLGTWRSEASILNVGIRASQGELIVPTHPEVVPGLHTLQALWDLRAEGAYVAAKIYYLTMQDQDNLDTVDWRSSNLAVRQLPGFYQEASAEHRVHDDYTHEATDRHTAWDSWVFGGLLRKDWQRIGGFYEFPTWGSVDVWFLGARGHHNIQTRTPMDPETICLHQNHDDPAKNKSLTPRDMAAAMGALSTAPQTVDHVWR